MFFGEKNSRMPQISDVGATSIVVAGDDFSQPGEYDDSVPSQELHSGPIVTCFLRDIGHRRAGF